ncbi:MAG: DUF4197 domain-containing protein [Gammaproteobacteria bacterium]|nr:DUF4197 domain-containing protein [Gammaproteobacteria bacterium]
MIQCDTTARKPATTAVISMFLVLASIGPSDSVAAGWLDKLKDMVSGDDEKQQALSADQIGGGLKEALRVGTERVVSSLGTVDGFNLDPEIHIPLPEQLGQVQKVLGKVGMDSMLTDLETRLNRAAEVATPKAKQLFIAAINDMTLDDVMAIYNGPEDSATQYFKSRMAGPLAVEMKPVVDDSLADVGAAKSYDAAMQRYNSVPFVPKVDADLSSYVVDKGMDGIFHYLAKEEAAIRQDPAKRTTDLLKLVFGK